MYQSRELLRAWLHRLEGLAMAIANAPIDRESDLVRLFHDLMASVPDAALLGGLVQPDPARIETLLTAKAPDSAAMAFIADDAGFCISRGGDGTHIASVVLSGASEESTASGPTLALACLGALALAVADAPMALLARAQMQDVVSLH